MLEGICRRLNSPLLPLQFDGSVGTGERSPWTRSVREQARGLRARDAAHAGVLRDLVSALQGGGPTPGPADEGVPGRLHPLAEPRGRAEGGEAEGGTHSDAFLQRRRRAVWRALASDGRAGRRGHSACVYLRRGGEAGVFGPPEGLGVRGDAAGLERAVSCIWARQMCCFENCGTLDTLKI